LRGSRTGGATIVYDHQWQGPAKRANLKAAAPGWLWLRKRLGPHFFDKVASVELVSGNRQFTAVELAAARVGRVPALPRALELKDVDFNALGYLPDLKRLKNIGDLNVTHAGIRRLGRLKRLERLILDNTSGRSKCGITDESVAFIEYMPRLTKLDLEGSHITDEGLAGIRWPADLRDLDLSGTPITDATSDRDTDIPPPTLPEPLLLATMKAGQAFSPKLRT
jgi:hypothetical protein